MYYVYILRSEKDGSYYSGTTTDLKRRFYEHNAGLAKYSKGKTPYKIAWYGAFTEKEVAYNFEQYLKSSSGHAFRNKHLL